jgi:hypothetical protein
MDVNDLIGLSFWLDEDAVATADDDDTTMIKLGVTNCCDVCKSGFFEPLSLICSTFAISGCGYDNKSNDMDGTKQKWKLLKSLLTRRWHFKGYGGVKRVIWSFFTISVTSCQRFL